MAEKASSYTVSSSETSSLYTRSLDRGDAARQTGESTAPAAAQTANDKSHSRPPAESALTAIRRVTGGDEARRAALYSRMNAMARYKQLVQSARVMPDPGSLSDTEVSDESDKDGSVQRSATRTKTSKSHRQHTASVAAAAAIAPVKHDTRQLPPPQQQPRHAGDEDGGGRSSIREPDADQGDGDDDEETAVKAAEQVPHVTLAELSYELPALEEPITGPSHPGRDSIRPDFEPVTLRLSRRPSIEKEAEAAAEPRLTSHLLPARHTAIVPPTTTADTGANASAAPAAVVPPPVEATPAETTPRLAEPQQPSPCKQPKQRVPHSAIDSLHQRQRAATGGVAQERAPRADEPAAHAPTDEPAATESTRASTATMTTHKTHGGRHSAAVTEEAIAVGGAGKTAFWIRPTAAMYAMTASIAAKRREPGDSRPSSARPSHEAAAARGASHTPRGSLAANDPRPPFTTLFLSKNARRVSLSEAEAAGGSLYDIHAAHGVAAAQRQRPVSARNSLRRSSVASSVTTVNTASVEAAVPMAATARRRGEAVTKHCARIAARRESAAPASARSAASSGTTKDAAATTGNAQRAADSPPPAKSAASRRKVVSTVKRGSARKAARAQSTASLAEPSSTDTAVRDGDSPSLPPSAERAAKAGGAREDRTTVKKESAGKLAGLSGRVSSNAMVHKRLSFDAETEPTPAKPVAPTAPDIDNLLVAAQSKLRHTDQPASELSDKENAPVGASQRPAPSRATRIATRQSPTTPSRRAARRSGSRSLAPDVSQASMTTVALPVTADTAAPPPPLSPPPLPLAALHAANARAVADAATPGRTTAPPLSARAASSEAMAAILQGMVQQMRRVVPCYYCGEMQNVHMYALHVDLCREKTVALLQERGCLSKEIEGAVERMAQMPVPALEHEEEERKKYSYAAFVCAKALLVPCRKCQTRLRIHDVKQHELLCGLHYYATSKAAQRATAAVARIDEGLQVDEH